VKGEGLTVEAVAGLGHCAVAGEIDCRWRALLGTTAGGTAVCSRHERDGQESLDKHDRFCLKGVRIDEWRLATETRPGIVESGDSITTRGGTYPFLNDAPYTEPRT